MIVFDYVKVWILIMLMPILAFIIEKDVCYHTGQWCTEDNPFIK